MICCKTPNNRLANLKPVDLSLLDCADLSVKEFPGAGLPQDVEG